MFHKQEFKKDVTRLSWFALIYLTVFHASLVYVTPILKTMGLASGEGQSGLLSLILVMFGLCLFAFYKRGNDRKELATASKKMTITTFLLMTMCVIGVQFLSVLVSPPLEMVFNLFGYSLQASNAAGAVKGVDGLIFLYGAIAAPITEELIFRGAMQASMAKYSRVFAIVFSSTIFALMHANFTQAVFAFFVGAMFGYIAMEYSIIWAIGLHLMNNLVYSEIIAPRIGGLSTLVTFACFIGLLVTVLIKRKAIKAYFQKYPAAKGMYGLAYTRLPFIIMVLVALAFALMKVTIL